MHNPVLNSLSDSVVNYLQLGQIGVVPTDTLYGAVCLASDENAVKRLYKLKKRDSKPGTVIAADTEQLIGLGFKARYLKAVQQFWPAPISIVIPSHELEYIHLGVGSIAVRIVADEPLGNLLKKTGPLLTSSANKPGQPPANTIQEAMDYFGEGVDFYVDGGDLSGRQPSTLIRIVDDAIEILRPGAVKITKSGEVII